MEKLHNYYLKTHQDYDGFLNVKPYVCSTNDIATFKKIMTIPSTKSTKINSGVLFVCYNDLDDIFECNFECELEHKTSALDNIDCLIMLSNKINNKHYKYLTTMLAANRIRGASLLFVEKLKKDHMQQLYSLSKTFYDQKMTNMQLYNKIMSDMKNGIIHIDIEMNDARQTRLEKILNITDADRRYNNREKIIYIMTIPRSDVPDASLFAAESEIIHSNLNDEKLMDEYTAITNAKKGMRNVLSYSGPKWVGRSDKIEIPGNKIGFAHELTDTIQICEILGVKPYTRREKRAYWKEKDVKDRNILFLSSIKGTYKLSKFKRENNLDKTYRIPYMTEFHFKHDIST
jgi:hypothetical protein